MTIVEVTHLSKNFILELMDNCEVINQANITDEQKANNFKALWHQLDGWSQKG